MHFRGHWDLRRPARAASPRVAVQRSTLLARAVDSVNRRNFPFYPSFATAPLEMPFSTHFLDSGSSFLQASFCLHHTVFIVDFAAFWVSSCAGTQTTAPYLINYYNHFAHFYNYLLSPWAPSYTWSDRLLHLLCRFVEYCLWRCFATGFGAPGWSPRPPASRRAPDRLGSFAQSFLSASTLAAETLGCSRF